MLLECMSLLLEKLRDRLGLFSVLEDKISVVDEGEGGRFLELLCWWSVNVVIERSRGSRGNAGSDEWRTI